VTNLSGAALPLPAGEVLLSSGPSAAGSIDPDTTVWLG
jgi:alpha-glucosidase